MRDEPRDGLIVAAIVSALLLGFGCYWVFVRTPPETACGTSVVGKPAAIHAPIPPRPETKQTPAEKLASPGEPAPSTVKSREAMIAEAIRTTNEEIKQRTAADYKDRTTKDLLALMNTVIEKAQPMLNLGDMEMLGMAGKIASFFYHAPGPFNLDTRKAALVAGLNNLSKEKLQTARASLGTGATDSEAFCVLASSLRWFVDDNWKFRNEGLDAALGNVTRSKVEKVKALLKDDADVDKVDQMALLALLLSSGQDYTKNGNFDSKGFNAALDSLSPADYANMRKQLMAEDKVEAAGGAFFILMRLPKR